MESLDRPVTADLWADRRWVPLAQAVVEKSCPVMGLDPKKTGRLTMAVEEIVMYLAGSTPGTAVSLQIIPGGWHVSARLCFTADPSELWAMNLCAGARVAADPDFSHLGLVLASRMTDRFAIRLEGRNVCLTLRQDKAYPLVDAEPGTRLDQDGDLVIEAAPDASLIKEACTRALGLYPPQALHQSFFKPGQVADMVAGQDLAMAVALNRSGEVAGSICWQGDRSLTFFGPYVFETGDRCAPLLTEHLIQRAARTSALGLFSGRATADLSKTDFEPLGSLAAAQAAGETGEVTVWYRHLGEDPGTAVWSHPDLTAFLEERYRALVLMRRIRTVQDLGEDLSDRSVISTRLRPRLSEAVLIPLVGGRDMAGCLDNHVHTLKKEGYQTILFHLDLAQGWQAALAGAALAKGFRPRMVLPWGGTSDLVVFQHESL